MKHIKKFNEAWSPKTKLAMTAATAVVGLSAMYMIEAEAYDVEVTDQNGVEREATVGEVLTGTIDKIEELVSKQLRDDIIIYIKTNKGETVEARFISDHGHYITIHTPEECSIDGKTYKLGDTVSIKIRPNSYYFTDRTELKNESNDSIKQYTITKLDDLAKEFGLKKTKLSKDDEEEGITNIAKWSNEDDDFVLLYDDGELSISFLSTDGISGNDPVNIWLKKKTWNEYFG